MNRAVCLIRTQPVYRRDAFVAGLQAAGYKLLDKIADPGPGDVLLTWNRYASLDLDATHWEKRGARVLIAENGYWGRDEEGRQLYAISAGQHHTGNDGPARCADLSPQGWKPTGAHILVCGQRGIGSKEMASPTRWAEDTAKRLRAITRREVRIRPHPGNHAPTIPLSDDLRNCWAVVTWSSNCGVQALMEGVPVFYEAPHWICGEAAKPDIREIENPLRDDALRHRAFERMNASQWTVAEIERGEPFRRLLPAAR